MIKNNLYNRIFNFRKFMREYKTQEFILKNSDKYISKIQKCCSLMELFELHKDLWNKGFQHPNIGPCPYGMFRTESIERMRPSQVFLGGIYGLLTMSIPDWERYRNTTMGGNGFGINPETPMIKLIVRQYSEHLISNIEMLKRTAENWLEEN